MTKRSWKLEQATFDRNEVEAITGVAAGLRRQWRLRGHIPPKEGGHGTVTVRELLWMLVLSRCGSTIGMAAAKSLAPAVDYALLHLVWTTLPLPVVGDADAETKFDRWSSDEARMVSWLRKQLGIPAGDLRRYLAFSPHDGIVALDNLAELDSKTSGAAQFVVDGAAIVKRVKTRLTKPPFVATVA